MIQHIRRLPVIHLLTLGAALVALSACATAPAGSTRAIGQRITVEGEVVSVDTAPWAYDGNAVVTISTADAAELRVQLPARWNLCKAPPLGDVQSLQPRDRVQVVGTMTAANAVVVCGNSQDRLRKVE